MVFKQDATSRIHLGSKMEAGIVKSSQETMDKEYSLIMSEIKDAVNTFSSKEFLEGKINRILGNNHRIAKPQEAIENVVKWSGLPNELTDDLLSAFIDGGDVTRFGIAQAMTWVAYDHADAELALELESSAAELMTASLQLN
jgi:ABC-type dipeptide/oligopeptide/nickel transport system ATPase subunit